MARKRKHPRRGRRKKRTPIMAPSIDALPLAVPQPKLATLTAALLHVNRLQRHG